MKKEVISQLLELVKRAAPEVECAVSEIKDARLRAAIGAVIMQRILQELDDTKTAALTKPPSFISPESGDEARKAGTQARILDLRSDKFFADPRRLEEVLEELRVRGYHHNKSDVRMSLLRLARKKSLRRIPLGEGRQRMYLYVNP